MTSIICYAAKDKIADLIENLTYREAMNEVDARKRLIENMVGNLQDEIDALMKHASKAFGIEDRAQSMLNVYASDQPEIPFTQARSTGKSEYP